MGVLFLSSPTTTMVTLSALLAVVMLVDGIIDMATYFTAKDFVYGAGWVLLDGVLTTIAGPVSYTHLSTNTGMHMALISRTSSLDIFMSFKISPPLHEQAVDIKII